MFPGFVALQKSAGLSVTVFILIGGADRDLKRNLKWRQLHQLGPVWHEFTEPYAVYIQLLCCAFELNSKHQHCSFQIARVEWRLLNVVHHIEEPCTVPWSTSYTNYTGSYSVWVCTYAHKLCMAKWHTLNTHLMHAPFLKTKDFILSSRLSYGSFESLELFTVLSAHVIASFIVALNLIDVAAWGYLWQLAWRSGFSCTIECCVVSFPSLLYLLLCVCSTWLIFRFCCICRAMLAPLVLLVL